MEYKKSRIRETLTLSTDADRRTNTKKKPFFWGSQKYFLWGFDKKKGGILGELHVTGQHITCHLSVQYNAVEPCSIVQVSHEVGGFTKNADKKNHQNMREKI